MNVLSDSLATERRIGLTSLDSELVRYFVASGLAFAVDAGTLFLLTRFGDVHYLTSAALGFMLGLMTVYLLSIRWVFATRRIEKSSHELTIFALIGIGGLCINELGIYLLTDRLLIHYMASKLLVTFMVFTWNFSVRKIILFR